MAMLRSALMMSSLPPRARLGLRRLLSDDAAGKGGRVLSQEEQSAYFQMLEREQMEMHKIALNNQNSKPADSDKGRVLSSEDRQKEMDYNRKMEMERLEMNKIAILKQMQQIKDDKTKPAADSDKKPKESS